MTHNIASVLERAAIDRPDQEAVVFPGSRVTYAALDERAEDMARTLSDMGIEQGDRVGILLNASDDYVALIFAIAKVNAVAVPISARFRRAELRHIVVHSGLRVLVTESPEPGAPDLPGLIAEAFPALGAVTPGAAADPDAPELEAIAFVASRPSALDTGGVRLRADTAAQEEAEQLRGVAVLVYTSGTTAAPKGAMLGHEALLLVAESVSERLELSSDDRVWTAIPLFHGGGIDYLLATLSAGATFVHPGFFDPQTALGYIDGERVTVALPAFETIWMPVLNDPAFDSTDLSRIRAVLLVGVVERLRAASTKLPHAPIVACVAMTEASAFVSLSRISDPAEARLTTGGTPLDGIECRIVDPDSGDDLGPGQIGELWFRGPNMFYGYFRDAEQTRAVIDEDGWFHTGDMCVQDDVGRLSFVSRLKDMLKVGGENVAAAEIEGYLLQHPSVQIAQVVAAPDARYVEVPAAFIQLREGAAATEDEIIDFCDGAIAAYRVPRYVRFVTEWPMSGTKIKKVDLRERIARELKDAGITEAPRRASRWRKD